MIWDNRINLFVAGMLMLSVCISIFIGIYGFLFWLMVVFMLANLYCGLRKE